jgi:hypothetical protein
MISNRVFAVLSLINWLVAVNSAKTLSVTFAETRPGQIPNGGFTQIATVSTPSVIGCAKLCWDNLNSTGCRGIIYQPDTCDGNGVKPSSPGLCQMLGSPETTPLTFGTANQSICQKFYSLPLGKWIHYRLTNLVAMRSFSVLLANNTTAKSINLQLSLQRLFDQQNSYQI